MANFWDLLSEGIQKGQSVLSGATLGGLRQAGIINRNSQWRPDVDDFWSGIEAGINDQVKPTEFYRELTGHEKPSMVEQLAFELPLSVGYDPLILLGAAGKVGLLGSKVAQGVSTGSKLLKGAKAADVLGGGASAATKAGAVGKLSLPSLSKQQLQAGAFRAGARTYAGTLGSGHTGDNPDTKDADIIEGAFYGALGAPAAQKVLGKLAKAARPTPGSKFSNYMAGRDTGQTLAQQMGQGVPPPTGPIRTGGGTRRTPGTTGTPGRRAPGTTTGRTSPPANTTPPDNNPLAGLAADLAELASKGRPGQLDRNLSQAAKDRLAKFKAPEPTEGLLDTDQLLREAASKRWMDTAGPSPYDAEDWMIQNADRAGPHFNDMDRILRDAPDMNAGYPRHIQEVKDLIEDALRQIETTGNWNPRQFESDLRNIRQKTEQIRPLSEFVPEFEPGKGPTNQPDLPDTSGLGPVRPMQPTQGPAIPQGGIQQDLFGPTNAAERITSPTSGRNQIPGQLGLDFYTTPGQGPAQGQLFEPPTGFRPPSNKPPGLSFPPGPTPPPGPVRTSVAPATPPENPTIPPWLQQSAQQELPFNQAARRRVTDFGPDQPPPDFMANIDDFLNDPQALEKKVQNALGPEALQRPEIQAVIADPRIQSMLNSLVTGKEHEINWAIIKEMEKLGVDENDARNIIYEWINLGSTDFLDAPRQAIAGRHSSLDELDMPTPELPGYQARTEPPSFMGMAEPDEQALRDAAFRRQQQEWMDRVDREAAGKPPIENNPDVMNPAPPPNTPSIPAPTASQIVGAIGPNPTPQQMSAAVEHLTALGYTELEAKMFILKNLKGQPPGGGFAPGAPNG